jgi:hypothetical protein
MTPEPAPLADRATNRARRRARRPSPRVEAFRKSRRERSGVAARHFPKEVIEKINAFKRSEDACASNNHNEFWEGHQLSLGS